MGWDGPDASVITTTPSATAGVPASPLVCALRQRRVPVDWEYAHTANLQIWKTTASASDGDERSMYPEPVVCQLSTSPGTLAADRTLSSGLSPHREAPKRSCSQFVSTAISLEADR